MRSCNHIKSDGRPCNAPALRKHSYCFFHQQQIVRRHREYPDRLPILEDRAAVQVAIMQVLDRLYLKTIDYKAAALMLYGLQLASTNLKQDVFFGRPNSEKVDRYYGNANEADRVPPGISTGAPSKPAVGLGGSVASLPEERYEGLGSVVSVPEARNEGSPARSAGFPPDKTTQVPEGRPTTAARLDDHAAEFERLYNSVIHDIKACTEDVENEPREGKLDAPPLSRSDRLRNENTLNCCHSERSEESLSSPNTLSGAPSKPAVGLGGSVVSVPEARDEGSPARSAGFQESGRSPFLPAAGKGVVLTTHNSRVTTPVDAPPFSRSEVEREHSQLLSFRP